MWHLQNTGQCTFVFNKITDAGTALLLPILSGHVSLPEHKSSLNTDSLYSLTQKPMIIQPEPRKLHWTYQTSRTHIGTFILPNCQCLCNLGVGNWAIAAWSSLDTWVRILEHTSQIWIVHPQCCCWCDSWRWNWPGLQHMCQFVTDQHSNQSHYRTQLCPCSWYASCTYTAYWVLAASSRNAMTTIIGKSHYLLCPANSCCWSGLCKRKLCLHKALRNESVVLDASLVATAALVASGSFALDCQPGTGPACGHEQLSKM